MSLLYVAAGMCISVSVLVKVDHLEVGKNKDCVYIYLHPGAIVNGK